tara:strand:+ start:643 stop:759 length:117 start_codon:yes stop_codon:yes gene_type:complete
LPFVLLLDDEGCGILLLDDELTIPLLLDDSKDKEKRHS